MTAPLTPETARDFGEALELARRHRFDRELERVERPDGTFILLDRATGDVKGAGFIDRGGREELPEEPF